MQQHDADLDRTGPQDSGLQQRGQVAAVLAVISFGLCALLLLGIIASLVYAAQQSLHVVKLNSEVTELEEEIKALRHQQALNRQVHQSELAQLNEQLFSGQSPSARLARPPTPVVPKPRLDVADPGTPPPPPPAAIFTASSRVEPEPPTAPDLDFPKPEVVNQRQGRLVPNVRGAGQFDRFDFSYNALSKQQRIHRDYSPLTFDKDFSHIYLVDGDAVLRKIELESFTEVARLPLNAACTEIAMSGNGLVVGLHHLGRIWVVDPESLEVRYELPLLQVEHVASSPASSMAWAIGQSGAIAFEVESGVVQNRISLGRGESLSNEMRGRFHGGLFSFRVSPDGTTAYTANRQLHQFDIDVATLTYRKSSPGLSSGHMRQMCMSRDGQWVARAGGGGLSQGPYAIPLFRADDLDEPALIVQTGAYPNQADWDLTNGRVIAHNHDEIIVFSARGQIEMQLKRDRGNDVYEIACLPIGNRFILWTDHNISVWDLEPGRLAQTLNAN